MLDLFDKNDLKVTYFIEAWNCPIYPDAIKHIRDRGHEVGFHAYQHEVWSKLDAATEVGNLEKSIKNAAAIGVEYKGFRPPGGILTPRTPKLLREHGFSYVSPAAKGPGLIDGIAIAPFQWESIDAYFYMEYTAPLRRKNGDPVEIQSPEFLKERMIKRVDEVVKEGGYLALLFHPFLQTDEDKMEAMAEVLKHVAIKREEAWLAPCKDVADWILEHPEGFEGDPGWDMAEWKWN